MNNNSWLWIIIIIIVVVILVLSINGNFEKFNSINSDRNNISVNNFRHIPPKNRFRDLVQEFGTPDVLLNRPNGMAIWYNKGIFNKIVLLDESIEHMEPEPHCDFLYASVKVYIPQDAICNVLGLSKSIYYDQLKQELTARCHFMGANVATLYLALLISQNPDNAEQYYEQYGSTIMSSMDKNRYNQLLNRLKQLVNQNNNQYVNEQPNTNCNIDN